MFKQKFKCDNCGNEIWEYPDKVSENYYTCGVCHIDNDDELNCFGCEWLSIQKQGDITYCKHPNNPVKEEGNNKIENCPLQRQNSVI